jgi:hypothetical protein
MDEGARVSWPDRKRPGELSAVQSAMNLYLTDPRTFRAEYQNDPEPPDVPGDYVELTADQVSARINRLPRGTAPREATRVTAAVDVQKGGLYWLACAWAEDFSGAVLDYGTFPAQTRPYYLASDLRPSFDDLYPALPLEARIYAALAALVGRLAAHDFRGEAGEGLKVERVFVDSQWGESRDAIYKFVREGGFKGLVLPSHGRGIPAAQLAMDEWHYDPRAGQRVGMGWKIFPADAKRGRHVVIDTNQWKTFVDERLRVPPGGKSGLWLFGDRPAEHELLADHLTAEYRVKTFGRGREVDSWVRRPDRTENHWLDCYSSDMDVLTHDGFRRFSDLTGDELLATVNLETDHIEYQRPTALIARPHNGEMVRVGGGRNSHLDLLVTPTHRMVIYAGQKSRGPVIREAGALTIWDKIKTAAKWQGDGRSTITVPASRQPGEARPGHPEVTVSAVDLASFLGWYIAEGSSVRRRLSMSWNHKVVISQNPGDKRDSICALLDRLPWHYRVEKQGVALSNEQAYRLVCHLGDKYTKRAPQWVKDGPPDVILAFLKSAVDGDGWRCRTGEAYATVSPGLADDIAELWLKAGHAVSMRTVPAKPWRIEGREGMSREQYHVHRKTTRWCLLRDSRNKPNFRREHYEGTVYCASVPNGTLIVRRNGKIAVCGNCLALAAAAASERGLAWSPGKVAEVGPAPGPHRPSWRERAGDRVLPPLGSARLPPAGGTGR